MEQYQIGDRVHDRLYPTGIAGNGTIIAVHPVHSPYTGATYHNYEVAYDIPFRCPWSRYQPIRQVIRPSSMLERL